jgi:hypothetical protein
MLCRGLARADLTGGRAERSASGSRLLAIIQEGAALLRDVLAEEMLGRRARAGDRAVRQGG